MTEEEWVEEADERASKRMLDFIIQTSAKPIDEIEKEQSRKLRLFACAACRRLWRLMINAQSQALVEVAERYADGRATPTELRVAADANAATELPSGGMGQEYLPIYGAYMYVSRAVYWLSDADIPSVVGLLIDDLYGATVNDPDDPEEEHIHQAALLRDIFANPLRPVAFDAAWRTDTAVSLAKGMYESRDFGVMPILADALQDAGCDSEDVLNHCRDPEQTHVRGCWVVDLVLGKS